MSCRIVFKTHPELRSYEAVPTYPKAGSVSFHNGLIAHGAAANMSPRARRAMTCALMPDGATYNGQQNVFTDAQVAKYKPGKLLCVSIRCPRLVLLKAGVAPQAIH